MGLKTFTDLVTLDTASGGQPFVQVAAKSGIGTASLDTAYRAAPFVGVQPGAVSTGVYPTGNAATGSLGTVGVAVDISLTGNVATCSPGSVAYLNGLALNLSGNTATGSVGSMAAIESSAPIADSGFALLESWQTYNNTTDMLRRWVYQLGNGGTLTSGGGSMTINGSVVSYCNTHISPLQKFRMGFNFLAQSLAAGVSNSSFLHLLQGGETNSNNQIGLGLNPNGTLSVFYGQNFSGLGGTTLANGTTVLSTNTNYWIEIDVQVATGTAGSVTVKINGVTEFALTGISTCATPYAWISGVSLVAGASTVHVFGGLYIGDGSRGWIGPSNVQRVLLAADTAQKDFAPSTGTANWSLLNTIDDTNYVSSTSLSATDSYTLTAPSPTPAAIAAVQVEAEALQTNSANLVNALQTTLTQSGVSAGRGSIRPPAALPASWSTAPRGIYDTTPSNAPWTPAALAAAQVGFRLATFSKGFNFRATAGYVTDKPSNTYVINDLYPTTRGGVTFGWDVTGAGTVVFDRTTAEDIYAGINCLQNTGAQRTFRVDVPVPGRYQIRLIAGDASYAHRQVYVQVKDGATPLFTIDSTTLSAAQFVAAAGSGLDAEGNANFSLSAWDEYNKSREVTLTGTVLNVTIGSPAAGLDWSCITHLEVVALDYVAPLVTHAPTVQVANLYVEALMPLTSTLLGNTATGTLGTPSVEIDIAITGTAATGAVGTVTIGTGQSIALTGNAAAGSPGTLSVKADVALAGNATTGTPGALTVEIDTALTGNAATGSLGTLTATTGVVVTLTGNAATGSPGTLVPSINAAVSGNAAVGAVGAVSIGTALTGNLAGGVAGIVSVGSTIVGNAAAGTPGTINTANGVSVALTGNAAAGSPGTLAVSNGESLPLIGNAAAGSVGAITASVGVALIGNAASGAPGNLACSVSAPITGNAATGAIGAITLQTSIPLTGTAAAGHPGTLTAANGQGAALVGTLATASPGTPAVTTFFGITGNAASGRTGVIGTGPSLTGNAATGAAGGLGCNVTIGLKGNAATCVAGQPQVFIARGTYVFIRTATSQCFVRQQIQPNVTIRKPQPAVFTRGMQQGAFTRSG